MNAELKNNFSINDTLESNDNYKDKFNSKNVEFEKNKKVVDNRDTNAVVRRDFDNYQPSIFQKHR